MCVIWLHRLSWITFTCFRSGISRVHEPMICMVAVRVKEGAVRIAQGSLCLTPRSPASARVVGMYPVFDLYRTKPEKQSS
jgi:hypothetical protein